METTKICIKCNTKKPLSEFAFRTDTNKYRNDCKTCKKLYNKEYIDNNKEVIYARHREYIKQYEKDNAEKIQKIKREYYLRNKEEILTRTNNYKKENKIYISRKNREYYTENKEAISHKTSIYKSTERGKLVARLSRQKRRVNLKNGNICINEINELVKNTNKCYWCNTKLKKDIKNGYHLDHYMPLSKGGAHTIENIVISCPKCNLSKNAKDPMEFANKLGRLL